MIEELKLEKWYDMTGIGVSPEQLDKVLQYDAKINKSKMIIGQAVVIRSLKNNYSFHGGMNIDFYSLKQTLASSINQALDSQQSIYMQPFFIDTVGYEFLLTIINDNNNVKVIVTDTMFGEEKCKDKLQGFNLRDTLSKN